MSNNKFSVNVGSSKLPILELSNKVKLTISKELQSQIMNLHKEVGDIEWSGPLFYEILKGDISDLANFELKAQLLLLGDIGSSAYTEYEPDESWMDFYDKYPQAISYKMGHIHTHHTMAK